jgi:hypothetical protein
LGPGVNIEERGQAGWSISSGEAELFTDTQLSKGIIINKKYSPLGGVCSSVYGSCEKCTTIELEGALTLPSILITELIWS